MAANTDIPYWVRSLGRCLRSCCDTPVGLPFPVRKRLLDLVRDEGSMHLLGRYPTLF